VINLSIYIKLCEVPFADILRDCHFVIGWLQTKSASRKTTLQRQAESIQFLLLHAVDGILLDSVILTDLRRRLLVHCGMIEDSRCSLTTALEFVLFTCYRFVQWVHEVRITQSRRQLSNSGHSPAHRGHYFGQKRPLHVL